ncbi:amidase domain-containing protein [Metabacillus niabensis]|uniref:amidase domain-containing protein n=1 Tax=Metabacillus niabensis TaxID=324854 RepID=UPI0039A2F353
MKQLLLDFNKKKLDMLINKKPFTQYRDDDREFQALERRVRLCEQRGIEIIKGITEIKITNVAERSQKINDVQYTCHHQWLTKQDDSMYLEERFEERSARIFQDELVEDVLIEKQPVVDHHISNVEQLTREQFTYDRLAAVQYAELWWNSTNPAYKNFEVNCTNFISQCLHAGGAKMRGYPNRSSGWWMQNNNWSYSWSVANSMRIFLANSKTGLRAKIVGEPEQLMPGDVICYDFQGDGRYDHTTFVVAKDKKNMPLVNAQTYNSRMRYWSYEDSTAYTPNIKYTFFRIIDDTSSK